VLGQLVPTETEVWGLLLATENGLPSGTVYPLLERLELEGFVESPLGR
jgi:PadR family transcriptional regulator PadR